MATDAEHDTTTTSGVIPQNTTRPAKGMICDSCFEYRYNTDTGDPEHGIAPGTLVEDLPKGWVCPLCGKYDWTIVID